MSINQFIKTTFLILLLALVSSCEKGSTPPVFIEGDGVVDFEGNSYKTVIIGDQEWMAENLRSNLFCSGDSLRSTGDSIQLKVYDDDPQNETVFGKLYNYQAVLDTSGLCPCGWNVPTELDFARLINYLGGNLEALKKMKSEGVLENETGLWVVWEPQYQYAGTNRSGFNALPGGMGVSNEFHDKDTVAAFWAMPVLESKSIGYHVRVNGVAKHSHSGSILEQQLFYSVRCIKTIY